MCTHTPTSWQVFVLCRWGMKWAILCLFVHKTKNSRRPVFTAELPMTFFWDFFFERHHETFGCNRKGSLPHFCLQVTENLNQCYGHHSIGHGGPRAGHPVHRTWFILLRICEAFNELIRRIMDCDVLMRNKYESTWKATGTAFQRTRLCVVIAGGHCEQ